MVAEEVDKVRNVYTLMETPILSSTCDSHRWCVFT